jgi:iron complex transport system substrate-binding protein
MFKKLLAGIFGAAVIVALCCALAWARQITDMNGRQVEVPDVIHKVYATAPPASYMILALTPDMLAGINMPHPRSLLPFIKPASRNLPVLGGWFGQGRSPNLESLLQAKPDVVVSFRVGGSAVRWKIEETLQPLGLPVVGLNMDRLPEYPAAFRFLGKLLGREARAEKLARYAEETLAAMKKLRHGIPQPERLTVYYAEGAQGLRTECGDSMHAELINLCGGVNVHQCKTSTVYGMETVSLEQVLRYDPQVILTHDPLFYKSVLSDPRWKNLRAVRNKRVYEIPRQPLNWFDRPPAFMRLLGAHWLALRLYPERYSLDLVSETRKFIALFLGAEVDVKRAREILKQ